MKNKAIPADKILHDTYFEKRPSLIPLMVIRAALLCVIASSLCLMFADLYLYRGDRLVIAAVPAALTGIVYTLVSVFPSTPVYAAMSVLTVVAAEFFRRRYLSFFIDYMCLVLDSRIIHTGEYTVHDLSELRSGAYNAEMNESFFMAVMLLSLIFSIALTYGSRTKVRPVSTLLLAAFVSVPAFAAEIAGFYPSYIIYITGFFGLEAVSLSYGLDSEFVFDSRSSAILSQYRQESAYKKRMAGSAFGRKLSADIPRYNKYSHNAVALAVTACLSFTAAAALIPEGKGLSYEEVLNTVMETFSDIADRFSEIFGTAIDIGDDSGYFSGSTYGDLSGSISIDPPGYSDQPVLEVTVQRNDIPVFLRGDIGISFNGDSWDSVTDKYADTASGYPIPENFYPELSYRIFRQRLAAAGYAPDDVIPLQTISVKYLTNTRVVLQPLAPYELIYKMNRYYNSSGDFILRTKKGFIKTHESLALTPCITAKDFSIGSDNAQIILEKCALIKYSVAAADYFRYSGYDDIGYDSYMTGLYAYEDLVTRLYGRTDGKYSDVLGELVRSAAKRAASSSIYNDTFAVSQAICDYFAENFRYSLTADNGKDALRGFLEDTHEGHCALFATAMTLALREAGIPARYITGYVIAGPGEKTADGYKYVLTEKKLHAWTEVYFEGFGWLPFDPTGGVPGYTETVMGENSPAQTTTEETEPEETMPPEDTRPPEETKPPETEPEKDPDSTDNPLSPVHTKEDLFTAVLPWAAGGAVALALIITAVMFVRSVSRAEKRTLLAFSKLPPHKAASLMYRFILKLLEKEGLVPGSELLYEFAMRVDEKHRLAGMGVFMADVVNIIEKNEFADPKTAPLTEEEFRRLLYFTGAVYKNIMAHQNRVRRFFIKISLFL